MTADADAEAGAGSASARGEPLVGRGHAHAADDQSAVAERAAEGGRSEPRAIARPSLDAARPSWWSAPGRVRLGLGLALVVALAGAWIALEPRGTPAVDGPPVTNVATTILRTPSTPAPVATTAAVPHWVPAAIAATCIARAGVAPVAIVVDCRPGRGVARLRYAAYASLVALRHAYANVATRSRRTTGPPACARGRNDERAWSTAQHPANTVGRYRCTSAGNARIVWTDERVRVLATASRADDDLRSLYVWWTTVPGPFPTGRDR